LRKTVQIELRRLHEAHRRTTIYVTHDQEEALTLSDRIAVMREGRIVQVGSASDLYTFPADAFVASFIGESNLLSVRVVSVAGDTAEVEVPSFGRRVAAKAAAGVQAGTRALLLVRPENLRLASEDGVAATVDEVVYLGELLALELT